MADYLNLTLAQAATPGSDAPANDAPAGDPAPAELPDGPSTTPGAPGEEGAIVPQPGTPKKDQPTSILGDPMFMFLILGVIILWVFVFNGPRREKKKRQSMLEALSKNDRVVTIGGIMGTVVEVKDNEVVLKVDESSNTRMRFSRNAIQGVVSEETGK